MRTLCHLRLIRSVALCIAGVWCLLLPQAFGADPAASRYETRSVHDPDGLGKFFMGREIARVMGHEGSDWLERREREEEERPDLLIEALKLKSGEMAADIGAGTGYYTNTCQGKEE